MRPYRVVVMSVCCLLVVVGAMARADQCDPSDPNLLLPDLVALSPSDVQVRQEVGHTLVIFATTIGNIGDGPLIVQGQTVTMPDGQQKTQATQVIMKRDGTSCTHLAGYFVFHPSHHHFHIEDFASYQLRQTDPFTGPIVAESNKTSFCLLDEIQLKGYSDPRQVNADCSNPDGIQGISVGYADVYGKFLPGQFIDLTADNVGPGDYFLVNVANPDGEILEKTMDNNTGVASIRVPASLTSGYVPPPPPTDPHVPPALSSGHQPQVHAPHAPHTLRPPPHPHAPHRPPHLHVTLHPGIPGQPTQ